MNKIKFWDFSRLSSLAAWKKLLCTEILVALLYGICVIYLTAVLSSVSKLFGEVCIGLYVLFLLAEAIEKICQPDDFFLVGFMYSLKPQVYKVRVYSCKNPRNQEYFSLKFECGHRKFEISAGEYEHSKIAVPEKNFMIFRGLGEDEWQLISAMGNQPQYLGKRLAKTVFLASRQEKCKVRLNMLHPSPQGYAEIKEEVVNSFVLGGIYLPCSETSKAAADTSAAEKTALYNVMLLKRDGAYELIGLYEDKGAIPFYMHLIMPAVIFREYNQTVILLWQEGAGYRERYRGANVIRKADDSILEMYDDNGGLHGRIYRFHPETLKLIKEYDGRIFGIDFDSGQVICEDGRVYNP